jgi:hypothetical protein
MCFIREYDFSLIKKKKKPTHTFLNIDESRSLTIHHSQLQNP